VDSLEEYLEDLNAPKKVEVNQQPASIAEVNQQPLSITTEPLLFQQERQSFNPFTTLSLSQPMNSYNGNPFSPTSCARRRARIGLWPCAPSGW
jgi:hypothetical protein